MSFLMIFNAHRLVELKMDSLPVHPMRRLILPSVSTVRMLSMKSIWMGSVSASLTITLKVEFVLLVLCRFAPLVQLLFALNVWIKLPKMPMDNVNAMLEHIPKITNVLIVLQVVKSAYQKNNAQFVLMELMQMELRLETLIRLTAHVWKDSMKLTSLSVPSAKKDVLVALI